MCLTCGCMLPHDRHGSQDHLIIEDLEKSARVDNMTLDKAVENLLLTIDVAKHEKGHHHR